MLMYFEYGTISLQMRKFLKPLAVSLALLFFLSFLFSFSFAEEINQNAAQKRREELQRQLDNMENQIESYRQVIQQKQTESSSLERDIAILDVKIKKAKLEIRKLDIEIERLKTGINQKSGQIKGIIIKRDKEKDSLAELIRKNNEMDSASLAEVVLGYEKLSDFFVVEDTLEPIHDLIQKSLDEISRAKIQLEKEKDDLEERQDEQAKLRTAQERDRKKVTANEEEKKNILKVTKGVEKTYQIVMKARQKDAANIRSQLFLLSGSPSISFEKAVEYANAVWNTLKIRPAFLLGIIREESNLGANIGKGNWKEDLSHPKCAAQRDAFVKITSELGLDPDLMPVSKRQSYGYCGGAMGPAQFMPITWWNPAKDTGYKKLVAKITGKNLPSPWDPKDAFMAAGLLLKDNGAADGGYDAERRAALRYLAGSNWKKSAYSFYGDDVMEFAADYQEQIDIINKMVSR